MERFVRYHFSGIEMTFDLKIQYACSMFILSVRLKTLKNIVQYYHLFLSSQMPNVKIWFHRLLSTEKDNIILITGRKKIYLQKNVCQANVIEDLLFSFSVKFCNNFNKKKTRHIELVIETERTK